MITVPQAPVAHGRLLIVDLNNFAYYPTIAVGYLVAVLRRAGYRVEVLSPLSLGVPSGVREKCEGWIDHLERRISYSTRTWIQGPRSVLSGVRARWRARPEDRVRAEIARVLADPPDAILISAYTDSYQLCVDLAAAAQRVGVPVLIGGPAFNQPRISEHWRTIPGVVAIVGGEVENTVAAIVGDAIARRSLVQHAGVFLPDGRSGPSAPPLRPLDQLPYPDYDDFPWHLYPHRIVPILTGRGCGWARCTFCGDIVTASGRGYRSRHREHVLDEIEAQTKRYRATNITFLDIKLNSNLAMWKALSEELPRRVPGAKWIATVHVGAEPNGLSAAELRAAAKAGLTRVTFGLESGSQRLLDLMDKGTRVEANSEFLRHASEAGISVRCTMIQGYPGETASDVQVTARFLEQHARWLDRVRLNPFNVLVGAHFTKEQAKNPQAYPDLVDLTWEYRYARARYRYLPAETSTYRRALPRLLRAIHSVNRKPLKELAREFDGVM
jgi:radical SAM superfamily enzyme YgiQ (UPF0313 family)